MMPTRAPISRSKAWRSTPANTPCSTCCARKQRDRQRRNRHIVRPAASRSEEHTSELQSLMRTSYAVFCLKQKKNDSRRLHLALYDQTESRICQVDTMI